MIPSDFVESESMNNAMQAVAQAAEIASEIIARLAVNYTEFLNDIISSYPNKRLVFLALHHPKKRVRKKNVNRIMKNLNHK